MDFARRLPSVTAALLVMVAGGCDTAAEEGALGFGDETDAASDPTAPEPASTTGDADSGQIPGQSGTTTGTTGGGETGAADPGECGNGIVDGDESCDGDAFAEDLSCESLGFQGGALICTAGCSYDSSDCYVCGNGVIEGPETCEGEVPFGVSCESEGFTAGEISCDATACLLDTSGCSQCGDAVVEGLEQCDSGDLGGRSCASIGFSGGALACTDTDCTVDVSGCSGGAFFDDFEAGSLASVYETGGAQAWTVTANTEVGGSFSAQSGNIVHNETSSLTMAVVYSEAGTVSFDYRVSTEPGFDYLRFFVDGVQQGSWSGVNSTGGGGPGNGNGGGGSDPINVSFDVAAGWHTFEWRYTKDGSVDSNDDTVWIDDLTLTGGIPGTL